MNQANSSRNWLAYIVLTLVSFAMIIPVYIMFKVSVSASADVLTAHPPFGIVHFTWEHWIGVFESGNLWEPLRKSFVVATFSMILAVIVASPASYVISRMDRKWKYTFILGLLFTRMFPDVGIALPISVNFIQWNLIDTDIGLVLAHLIPNLPFLAWILVGTFESIPRDLEQSAYIDGASRLQSLMRVVFPLAAPGIAVGALFVWLNSWNEFTYALYLTVSDRTLPLMTYYYINRGDWFQSASYSVFLTIPVIIITFFLQRYLKAGHLSGAVKG